MTSNKLVNAYENYFLSIKNLPVELKENTIEFVFAYRKGIETVTLVTENPYIISKSFIFLFGQPCPNLILYFLVYCKICFTIGLS